MRMWGSAVFALRGVTANTMRSVLTTLGILIGVAAVIILVAVGTGSSQAVKDSLSRLGSNTLTIRASQGGQVGWPEPAEERTAEQDPLGAPRPRAVLPPNKLN